MKVSSGLLPPSAWSWTVTATACAPCHVHFTRLVWLSYVPVYIYGDCRGYYEINGEAGAVWLGMGWDLGSRMGMDLA